MPSEVSITSTNLIGKSISVHTREIFLTSDRALQCPTWGYPTEGAYYRDATSTDSMLAIRIPFLSIQAEDDPVSHDPFFCFEDATDVTRLLAERLSPIMK